VEDEAEEEMQAPGLIGEQAPAVPSPSLPLKETA
jgi:hypothetical protein